MASSWKKTITTPFKKAATFFNQQQQQPNGNGNSNGVGGGREKKSLSQRAEHEQRVRKELQGEVMACGYEDIQVMWSILDKSNSSNLTA